VTVRLLLIAMLAACNLELQDAETAGDDAESGCHFDCFEAHECDDGGVTSWESGPIACSDWQGECPHGVSVQCERGCRIDLGSVDYVAEPQHLCEEHRPKRLGDVCAEEAHCHPQVAVWNPDGTITNVYLRCDLATGTCVEREPPVIPDFLVACAIEAPIEPLGTFTQGVRTTDLCSGGVCLFYEDSSESCVWQGCTATCDSDDDCPVGTFCGDFAYGGWVCQPAAFETSGITCQP
jgi:hypothetical protein